MPHARLIPILLVSAALPATARADEVTCWFDGGVIVAPAEVAGIAGDFVIDTGQAVTQLHETRAQAEGVETDGAASPALSGAIRLAGLELPARTVAVADLDYRGWNLPTPIAGVIGADVLKDLVVDLSFAPCRLALWRPGRAPRFRGAARLPIRWDAGRPVVKAEVSDGERRLRGHFAIATGQPAAVRLAEDVAHVAGTERQQELGPAGIWLARLSELRLGAQALTGQPAGLEPVQGEAAGAIGGPALARFRLRLDFPRRRLHLAPALREP